MKIIRVDCCLECPYISIYVGDECACMHDETHGRNVKWYFDEKTLPNWCPLEEATDENNQG